MLQLRKLFHREGFQIGLFFDFDEELIKKAKKIGARWSKTNKCWYVLYKCPSFATRGKLLVVYNDKYIN